MKNGQCVEGLMQKDVGLQLLLIHFGFTRRITNYNLYLDVFDIKSCL